MAGFDDLAISAIGSETDFACGLLSIDSLGEADLFIAELNCDTTLIVICHVAPQET